MQSSSEFKGPHDEQGKILDWTPEDLYIASVAVCLFTSFVAIAEKSRLEYTSITINASGKLEKVPDIGMMITEIEENVTINIHLASLKEKTLKILEKSKKYCLI